MLWEALGCRILEGDCTERIVAAADAGPRVDSPGIADVDDDGAEELIVVRCDGWRGAEGLCERSGTPQRRKRSVVIGWGGTQTAPSSFGAAAARSSSTRVAPRANVRAIVSRRALLRRAGVGRTVRASSSDERARLRSDAVRLVPSPGISKKFERAGRRKNVR
jgi:hypothetical protein